MHKGYRDMADIELVVQADKIMPFTLPGDEGIYESQCVIDRYGVHSERLSLNRFTLKAGKKLDGGSHPPGNDECYYVVKGRAQLALGGDPQSGEGGTIHDIGPETTVFIPGGTYHALDNPYDEDLVILTMWPRLPEPGANPIYDERIRAWGTSFRKRSG